MPGAADIRAPRQGVADSHPAAEAADNRSAAEAADNRSAAVAEDNRPGAAEGGIRHRAAAVGSRPADAGWLIGHENLPAIGLEWQRNLVENLVNQRLSFDIPEREQDRHEPKNAEAEPGSHPVDDLAQK